MGPPSKPLITPKPRRRDRPAGERSAFVGHVRRQARAGWAGDAGRSPRDASDRQGSYARLLARYDRPTGSGLFRAIISAVLIALGVLIGRSALESSDLAPLDDARSDYERLVTLAASVCAETGTCVFGRQSPERPPPAIRALMPRVRARDVFHDSVTARTILRGDYSASFYLRFSRPPTARQERARVALVESERAYGEWWTPAHVERLGDGWERIEGR